LNNPQPASPLQTFIAMDDADQAAAYLQEHLTELLTDTAIEELGRLWAEESDPTRRQRLEERLQILGAVADHLEQMASMPDDERLFMALMATVNSAQIEDLVKQLPDHALDTLEQTAEAKLAESEGDEAEAIRERLEILGAIRQAEEISRNPIMKAVIELIQTEDDATARALFNVQGSPLLTVDACHLLEQFLEAAKQTQNEAAQARIEARLKLWHEARFET